MKQTPKAATIGFWKPKKEGETIEGTFVKFSATNKGGAAMSLTGCPIVGMSHVLRGMFRDAVKKDQVKPGAKVKIEFTGKSGRAFVYRAWLNGKELEGGGFKALTNAETSKVFDDQDQKDEAYNSKKRK